MDVDVMTTWSSVGRDLGRLESAPKKRKRSKSISYSADPIRIRSADALLLSESEFDLRSLAAREGAIELKC